MSDRTRRPLGKLRGARRVGPAGRRLIILLVVGLVAAVMLFGFINPGPASEFLRGASLALLVGIGVGSVGILASTLLFDTPYRRRAWIVLAIIGTFGGLTFLALNLWLRPLADVRAYYDAGARLNAGLPLYPSGVDVNAPEFYRYPPLLAIIFRPIAACLSYQAAAALWEAFCILTLGLTLRRIGLRRFKVRIALGVLLVSIGWALLIGQAQVPVTWLLTIGSPWAIAFATNLKLFPGLVAIFWLGRRDWHSLKLFTAAMAGLALFQLVIEPTGSMAFLNITNLSQAGGTLAYSSFSPYLLSPVLWAGLVITGALVALRLAPTRVGWAAAVAFSVLSTPRLFNYIFMSLLAGFRPESPKPARELRGPMPKSTDERRP